MLVFVTGVAGFIGYHCARSLLEDGIAVFGIDDLNPYYDPALKRARLGQLGAYPDFRFVQGSIVDRALLLGLESELAGVTHVLHLAAQPGVRYSLENPLAYVEANVLGHGVVLELTRRLPKLEHFVYASSSSVYGGGKGPLSPDRDADHPVSVYGATKRAGEILSDCYAHLYGLPATGLRYFTVYGPWGRPDMAPYLFSTAILRGEPIRVFNRGNLQRDFTYIDDIVAGTRAALARTPGPDVRGRRHALYNLGAERPEPLMRFIEVVERACGRTARKELVEMQLGDVEETWADISASKTDLGYEPVTAIDEGVPKFVAWLRQYHGF
jgi:UDP-glucuronate 4-epimerase